MKRLLVIAAAIVMMASFAPAEVTTNEIIPVGIVADVPCANGGAGELIVVEGYMHVLLATTVDANGNVHVKAHFQPQRMQGTGLVTGDKYNATGVTQWQERIPDASLPYVTTYINNFRLIGQGPGNNLSVHETYHITVNANGEVTAEVLNQKITCK